MAINDDPFISSIEGLLTYEISAEIAEKESDGPGTFKIKLFDEIYNFRADYYNTARVKYL
jgi:hydroxyethylthiazole kinase